MSDEENIEGGEEAGLLQLARKYELEAVLCEFQAARVRNDIHLQDLQRLSRRIAEGERIPEEEMAAVRQTAALLDELVDELTVKYTTLRRLVYGR